MKKIMIVSALCATVVSAFAGPYVGLQVGGYFLKNKNELFGKHNNGVKKQMLAFKVGKDTDLNSFRFGILAGYAHKVNEKLSILTDVDFTFGNKKESAIFDTSSLANTLTHTNPKQNVQIKTGIGFGIMPMVSYQIKDKLHGLLGVRLAAKNYEVKGYHENQNGTVHADNVKTEKKYLFSFEPNVGAQYEFSDKVSGRFLVGYNFGSRKTMFNNYMNSPAKKAQGIGTDLPTAGISINPKGVVVRAMVTYSF